MEGINIAMANLKKLERRLLKLKDAEIQLDLKYPFDTEKYVYDPDSSLRAWEYYFKMYKELLSNVDKKYELSLFKEKFVEKRERGFWKEGVFKRIKGTFCYFKEYKYIWPYELDVCDFEKYRNIGIAGDCVFNFNEKKVSYFRKMIGENNNKKNQQIKEILLLCSLMHYSPFNFSLMPVTGGNWALNIIKGIGNEDRIDVFLKKLKNIYEALEKLDKSDIKKYDIEKFDTYIQNMGKIGAITVEGDLQKGLIHFLWCIGSFENYCKIFYQLDYEENEDNLVNKLIKNAEKNESIKNPDQLVKYMELAVEYWKKQKKNMKRYQTPVNVNIKMIKKWKIKM